MIISVNDFFTCFPIGEQAAYVLAVKQANNDPNPSIQQAVLLVIDRLLTQTASVDLRDPNVLQSLDALKAAGILSVESVDNLLAKLPARTKDNDEQWQ